MHLRESLLFGILIISIMIFGIIMFPLWNVNVCIPFIPLTGLGSWLFGRRVGLVLVILNTIYLFFLWSVLYGDRLIYYEANGSGVIILTATAIIVGNLRSGYDALKATNKNLDCRVKERTKQLNNLATKLIERAEKKRIYHGQKLHDGIGQQLTGIQLYCTSLAEQLLAEGNTTTALAYSIRANAEKAHNSIRKTARMLFPVRMKETGLAPAVKELAACFGDQNHVSFDITTLDDCSDVSDQLALSLYRICHESSMSAVAALNANLIRMAIKNNAKDCQITIEHNGNPWAKFKDNIEQRLVLYRLQLLGGHLSIIQPQGKCEIITYRIPKSI